MRSYRGSRTGLQGGAPGIASLAVVTVLVAGAALVAWARGHAPAPEAAALIVLLAAAPLAFSEARAAIAAKVRAFAPSILAFAVAFAAATGAAAFGASGPGGSVAALLPTMAAGLALVFAALGLAALTAARPWRQVNTALLAVAIVTAIASAAASFAGGAERPLLAMSPDAAGAFYGLVAVQAFTTIADETFRRARGGERLGSFSQRTFAPTLALIVAALMIAMSGSRLAIIATLVGCAFCAGMWTMRERKPTVGAYRILAAVLGMAALGLSLAWAQAPGAHPGPAAASAWAQALDTFGLAGAVAISLALIVALGQVAMAADRGRRPGRGACLIVPAAVLLGLCGLASAALGAFAIPLWGALLVGLGAGLADPPKAAEPLGVAADAL